MKRFTETSKWDKAWFRKLPCKLKVFWDYVCGKCDCAGIWEVDLELASFNIGEPLEEWEIFNAFGDRIRAIGNGKWWLTGFIEFQYGQLSRSCNLHIPIFKSLARHGLTLDEGDANRPQPPPEPPVKGLPAPPEGVAKGLDTLPQQNLKGCPTLMEKEKEKEKERDRGLGEGSQPSLLPEFEPHDPPPKPPKPPEPTPPDPPGRTDADWAEEVYGAYPLKAGKPDALAAIRKALKKHPGAVLLERTLAYAKAVDGTATLIPHPATWFNRERFNDNPSTWPKQQPAVAAPVHARNAGCTNDLEKQSRDTAAAVAKMQERLRSKTQ